MSTLDEGFDAEEFKWEGTPWEPEREARRLPPDGPPLSDFAREYKEFVAEEEEAEEEEAEEEEQEQEEEEPVLKSDQLLRAREEGWWAGVNECEQALQDFLETEGSAMSAEVQMALRWSMDRVGEIGRNA